MANFMPGESGGMPTGILGNSPTGLLGGNPWLNIGLGILANNTGNYGAFGPAIGRGAQQGIQQTQQALHLEQLRKLADLQMKKAELEMEQERKKREALKNTWIPASSIANMPFREANDQLMAGQTPDYQINETPAGFDINKLIPALAEADPELALQYQTLLAKQNEPIKAGAGDVFLDPKTMKPLYSVPQQPKIGFTPSGIAFNENDPSSVQLGQSYSKPESKPTAIQEYQFAKEQGYPGSFVQFQLSQKKAGAPSTSIKIDNKTGEGLAKEVGPMVAASKGAAEGALQTLDIANRLDAAANSGKLISGPLAGGRVKLLQIGQVLGINGADESEILSNTRGAIQGLSQFALAGRAALKGQGQISDYEGKLLQKATSGNIEDLTVPELKVISNTAKRVAKAQYAAHKKNIDVMKTKPELSGLVDFYDVPDLPSDNSNILPKDALMPRTKADILKQYGVKGK